MCVGGETHREEDSVVLQRERTVSVGGETHREEDCSVTER